MSRPREIAFPQKHNSRHGSSRQLGRIKENTMGHRAAWVCIPQVLFEIIHMLSGSHCEICGWVDLNAFHHIKVLNTEIRCVL